jgi:hypothetical protein
MPDNSREPFLDLPEDQPSEHLDDQVARASEQEHALKRQLEIIERQKRELAELSRRQDQLNVGKTDLINKLTLALGVVERETYEAQKRLELLQGIDGTFRAHLDSLEAINPKLWEGYESSALNRELTRSLSAVENARVEFGKSFPKIGVMQDATDAGADASGGYMMDTGGEKDFIAWLKAGFAFTLPLLVLGLIYLIIFASK